MTEWFDEALHPGLVQRLSVDRLLYRSTTDRQELLIFENRLFGRVLALDGIVQTTEGDEFIYHEMLAHVPIVGHGSVRTVLIIGGGDGGTAREVLRHRRVEAVTMVEIDRAVVDLCATWLPKLSDGAFEDPRLELVIADGARFVAETDRTWDVIIVDSTDPVGPGEVLFTAPFYRACNRCLKPGGVLVTQNGVPHVQGEELTSSYRNRVQWFDDVWFYLAPVPTYQGGHMALGWSTDDTALRQTPAADLRARFDREGFTTRYYTPEVHAAAFALPVCVTDLMN